MGKDLPVDSSIRELPFKKIARRPITSELGSIFDTGSESYQGRSLFTELDWRRGDGYADAACAA